MALFMTIAAAVSAGLCVLLRRGRDETRAGACKGLQGAVRTERAWGAQTRKMWAAAAGTSHPPLFSRRTADAAGSVNASNKKNACSNIVGCLRCASAAAGNKKSAPARRCALCAPGYQLDAAAGTCGE